MSELLKLIRALRESRADSLRRVFPNPVTYEDVFLRSRAAQVGHIEEAVRTKKVHVLNMYMHENVYSSSYHCM